MIPWYDILAATGAVTCSVVVAKKLAPGLPATVVAPGTLSSSKLYQAAVARLGQRLTLNPNVPEDEGCAEAVSVILKDAGYTLPAEGIATVNGIIAYCVANGFVEVSTAAPGDIVAAHNPDPANTSFAHVGVCLKYGIASNTSFAVTGFKAGVFAENYSYHNFTGFFERNGSKVRYFSPVDSLTTPS